MFKSITNPLGSNKIYLFTSCSINKITSLILNLKLLEALVYTNTYGLVIPCHDNTKKPHWALLTEPETINSKLSELLINIDQQYCTDASIVFNVKHHLVNQVKDKNVSWIFKESDTKPEDNIDWLNILGKYYIIL